MEYQDRNTNAFFAKTAFFLLLLTAFFLFPRYAFGLSAGGVGGYPANPDPNVKFSESWFIYNLDLGESKEDAIHVFNTTDETQVLKIYPVDSIGSNQGNFALEKEADSREGVGAWITIAESKVVLEPGESMDIPFTISIPPDADVGEHSGGIILEKTSLDYVPGKAGASIVTRVGVRVYQTVPGDIVRDLVITDFEVQKKKATDGRKYYEAALAVENTGNVSIRPAVELHITGWGKTKYFNNSKFSDGMVIDLTDAVNFFDGEILKKDWQLLRDQKVKTHWEWPYPRFGRYVFQAKIYLTEGSENSVFVTDPIAVLVIPWMEIIIFLILFATIIAFVFLKRRGPRKKNWSAYTVAPGEQLVDIASRHDISWKKLAKANKLKSPKVEEGDEILVPPEKGRATVADKKTGLKEARPALGKKDASAKKTGKKTVKAQKEDVKTLKDTHAKPVAAREEKKWKFLKRFAFILIQIIILILFWMILSPEPRVKENEADTNTNTQVEQKEEKPDYSQIQVGIYEPEGAPAGLAELLKNRLEDVGFNVAIYDTIVDPSALLSEKTTVLYSEGAQDKVKILADEVFTSTLYRQGKNDGITGDIVIAAWNIEDIRWKEFEIQAEKYLRPDKDSVSVRIDYLASEKETAENLRDLLKGSGYSDTSIVETRQQSEGMGIRHQRNFKEVAKELQGILAKSGVENVSYRADVEEEDDVVITVGSEAGDIDPSAIPEADEGEKEADDETTEEETAKTIEVDPSILILNGNGTPGLAGEAMDFLQSKGYGNLDAANADNFDYYGVTIFYDSGLEVEAEKIGNILKGKYGDFVLEEGAESADIVVRIGS